MKSNRFLAPILTITLSIGILIGAAPTVAAKSLVGTACIKIGIQKGDGPGKSVVCKQVGKKKLWQILKRVKPASTTPSSSNQSPKPENSQSSSCAKAPEFTHHIIDPKYVRVVTPIGEQTGTGGVIAVRSYIHPAQEFLGQELPIYAPTNITLYQASFYKPPGSADNYKPEYSLYFKAECGISVKFFHIKGVVGKVAKAVPSKSSNSSAGQNVTSTLIKAGEQIGWYKLGEASVAFDFWVDDERVTNKFIVQSHFSDSNALHSVCPYNFYSPAKKAIWLAKLGAPGSDPIPGTECGVISQGVSGTADGMWFFSPETQNDRLTYEGAYQSQIMFSADASGIIRIGGLNASAPPAQMMISPNASTWKKATDITVGATHCWSDGKQAVKVNVISSKTMSVLVGSGTCDSLSSTALSKTYFR